MTTNLTPERQATLLRSIIRNSDVDEVLDGETHMLVIDGAIRIDPNDSEMVSILVKAFR